MPNAHTLATRWKLVQALQTEKEVFKFLENVNEELDDLQADNLPKNKMRFVTFNIFASKVNELFFGFYISH